LSKSKASEDIVPVRVTNGLDCDPSIRRHLQDHQHNDNQDQFHEISPLMATAFCAAYQEFNGVFEVLFLIDVQPSTCIVGHDQICSTPTQGSSVSQYFRAW
jgi:hypothetical protein